jgi:KaiC/GvpD/RAD55 family RecA-like ATPase
MWGQVMSDSLKAICAQHVEPLPTEWLWRGYIPRGTITIIDGDPGVGKSQVTIDIASRVSRGWAMPPEAGGKQVAEPGTVLMLSAEDDAARTIRPRLDAAGADVNRVVMVDGDRPIVLPDDLPFLRSTADTTKAKLVIIDPLMAFLSGKVNAHNDADVRRVLYQVKRFADDTEVAVIIIRHLNKMTSVASAIYRGGGSIGIVGAARSALVVGCDPNDRKVRVLAGEKTNLAPLPPSLAFSIEPIDNSSRVGWIGQVDLTADEVIQHGKASRGRPAENLNDAVAFLAEQLKAGPKLAAEVYDAAESDGIKRRTLARARKELGVSARKSGMGGGWEWRLPDEGCQKSPTHDIWHPSDNSSEKPEGCQNSSISAFVADDLDGDDRRVIAALDADTAAERNKKAPKQPRKRGEQ